MHNIMLVDMIDALQDLTNAVAVEGGHKKGGVGKEEDDVSLNALYHVCTHNSITPAWQRNLLNFTIYKNKYRKFYFKVFKWNDALKISSDPL